MLPPQTLTRCALGLSLAVALSACGQAPLIVDAQTDLPQLQIMEHDLFIDSEVFQGDARITTTDELEQILGYSRITGNLTIAAPMLKEVVWPTPTRRWLSVDLEKPGAGVLRPQRPPASRRHAPHPRKQPPD